MFGEVSSGLRGSDGTLELIVLWCVPDCRFIYVIKATSEGQKVPERSAKFSCIRDSLPVNVYLFSIDIYNQELIRQEGTVEKAGE
jgi:hypothetical protein